MANLLIVDDDKLMCRSLSLAAQQKKHQASCAHTLAEAMEISRTQDFDLVFLDVNMPDGNGLECIRDLAAQPSMPEIIIITGYGDPHGAELAIASGAWDYLEKGASLHEITMSLQRALQYREQKKGSAAPLAAGAFAESGIIGTSSRLQDCLALVSQAATSDASLLITGATGTGKELFARAVHQISPRNPRKFVVVDCASLPDNLIEGILFGHEKGAYTSADHAREGLIQEANGGTLFLDEVGEMPLPLQKVFLRVLQEHRYRPLGSSRELTSDFRLVAATNRNLNQMVKEGTFRADLLFRLSTFMIELPTLQERADDIPLLARHHVDRICRHYGVASKEFSPEFLHMLTTYGWPGNVRELVNTLERTLAVARTEPVLFPKHLPTQIRIEVTRKSMRKHQVPVTNPLNTIPNLQSFRESICLKAEQQYLQNLMQATGNNVAEACRVSGLSTSRLYALLKKHGVGLQRMQALNKPGELIATR